MRTLPCIIVDDEPLALDLLEGYVRRTPFLQLVARCSSAFEAMEVLAAQTVDVIFLDIQMPGLNGMQFSKTLAGNHRIIFTTAFEKYALEGYKVDALDFLLKPFNYEEFLTAALKAKAWYERAPVSPPAPSGADYIFVRSSYRQVRIFLRDILYVEAMKDYVQIRLANEAEPLISSASLKSFEGDILPRDQFMRINRSYIIAMDKIDFIERAQVVIGGTRITISEQYREQFQRSVGGV